MEILIMAINTVKIKDMAAFIKINVELQLSSKSRTPFMLIGDPGMGKTAIIKAFCEENNLNYLYVSGIKPLEYFSGLPLTGSLEGGREVETAWAIPEIIVEANKLSSADRTKRGTLVFFDDIHLLGASEKYFFELILERSLNNHKLNSNVAFIAAANGGEKSGHEGFNAAIINRFALINVYQTYKDWYTDFGHTCNDDITSFMALNEPLITSEESVDSPFSTFRSWTELSHMVDMLDNSNIETYVKNVATLAYAYIAETTVNELKAFLLTRKRWNFDSMFKDKKELIEQIPSTMTPEDQQLFSAIIKGVNTPEKMTKYIKFINDLYSIESYGVLKVQLLFELAVIIQSGSRPNISPEQKAIADLFSKHIRTNKFPKKFSEDLQVYLFTNR